MNQLDLRQAMVERGIGNTVLSNLTGINVPAIEGYKVGSKILNPKHATLLGAELNADPRYLIIHNRREALQKAADRRDINEVMNHVKAILNYLVEVDPLTVDDYIDNMVRFVDVVTKQR